MTPRFLRRGLVMGALVFGSGCALLFPTDVLVSEEESNPSTTADAAARDGRVDARGGGGDTGTTPPIDDVPHGTPCTDQTACGSTLICTAPMKTPGTCAKSCCRSEDCPEGFVCWATGAGSYCLSPGSIGRSVLGTNPGGSSCTKNSDCRSGECATGVGFCWDTCCSDDDCSNGRNCGIGQISTSEPQSFVCVPAEPLKEPGSTCNSAAECSHRICELSQCRRSCCGSAGCLGGACRPHKPSGGRGESLAICLPTGTTALNASCTNHDACVSGYCDPDSKTCLEMCCRETDCAPGTRCRPSAGGDHLLRCERVQ